MPPTPIFRHAKPSAPPILTHLWKQIEEHRLKEEARVAVFGQIRPIIHIPDYAGYRFVVVRNRLYYSKQWKFFTDFLLEYGMTRFGQEWLEAQKRANVADQHPAYIWRKQAYAYMQGQKPQPD